MLGGIILLEMSGEELGVPLVRRPVRAGESGVGLGDGLEAECGVSTVRIPISKL